MIINEKLLEIPQPRLANRKPDKLNKNNTLFDKSLANQPEKGIIILLQLMMQTLYKKFALR